MGGPVANLEVPVANLRRFHAQLREALPNTKLLVLAMIFGSSDLFHHGWVVLFCTIGAVLCLNNVKSRHKSNFKLIRVPSQKTNTIMERNVTAGLKQPSFHVFGYENYSACCLRLVHGAFC